MPGRKTKVPHGSRRAIFSRVVDESAIGLALRMKVRTAIVIAPRGRF